MTGRGTGEEEVIFSGLGEGWEEEGDTIPELGEEARGESLPNMFWIENLERELSWLGGLCLFC